MFDQLSSKGDLHPEELFLHDGKKVSTPSSPRKPANDRVVGASVIDLRCLSKGIQELSKHNVDCRGKCTIAREARKMSLASILELVCDTCEKTFHTKSSPKISGSAEINQRYSVNVGAVWGSNVNRWGAEMTK